ncbi:chitin deacetylase [Rhizophlyctis rosea]|nr:chitin deacetylase [Rhizophlyctis rosea]
MASRLIVLTLCVAFVTAQSTAQQPPATATATATPAGPASSGGSSTGGSPVRLNVPPQMPAVWPSTDEGKMIDGAFLQEPLVTQAVAYVKSVVPAEILAIPPSTYKSGSTTTYNADAVANCYWPNNLCVRNQDTAYYKADVSVCPQANTWGITYDDGPINNNGVNDTEDLINNLAQTNVTSTFFCVGSNVIQYPGDAQKAYKAGHEISGHTWTHHPLTSLTNEQIVAEMKYTEAIIYNATGMVPAMFRPPYGDIDDRVRAIVSALGYRTIIWTTNPNRDTTDADGAQTDAVGAQILSTVQKDYFVAQPGFISLEHDISTFTTSVAIKILKAIQAARAAGTFPLTVTSVGKCNNLPVYQNASPITTTTTTSTTTTASATSTAVTGGNTVNIPDGKSQSAAMSTASWSMNALFITAFSVFAVSRLL